MFLDQGTGAGSSWGIQPQCSSGKLHQTHYFHPLLSPVPSATACGEEDTSLSGGTVQETVTIL